MATKKSSKKSIKHEAGNRSTKISRPRTPDRPHLTNPYFRAPDPEQEEKALLDDLTKYGIPKMFDPSQGGDEMRELMVKLVRELIRRMG